MAASSLVTGGSPLLMGNNTIPGVRIPDNILKKIPDIEKACKDFGLTYHPVVVEMLTYDEISEVAAYGGFPNRYPHWRWGMEYEELSRGYEFGMHRIYEMVINTNPLYIYCLDSNSEVDHVTVIAHAIGHGDFFKNNIFFAPTSGNMMNELASHATRIERYMKRWGRQEVGEFIDNVLSIDDLIDPNEAWSKHTYQEPIIIDKREYEHPHRFKTDGGNDYMNAWLNTPEWIAKQQEKIKEKEQRKLLGLFDGKYRDIFKFLKLHAPLTTWQQDVMAMLYEESIYFLPQRFTKTINEGWASFVDYKIMAAGAGMAGPEGIIEYAKHKAGVLGGKYSMNPYNLGFKLLIEIEERYNKGRFGTEYDECKDMKKKKAWDTKLGQGLEKVFEVRQLHNDQTLIAEFFDQEFCDKYEFYEWIRLPTGEYKIKSRDASSIKKLLLQRYSNGGLPDIRLVEPNYRNKRVFLMEHQFDGRTLHPVETSETLTAIFKLWKNPAAVATRDEDGNELIYLCTGPKKGQVVTMSRPEFEKHTF